MIISIRRRLLTNLLITISFVSITTLLLSYRDARHEVQELFDAQLAQSARVLQALVLPEIRRGYADDTQQLLRRLPDLPEMISEGDESATPLGHEYERKLTFQVWNNEKHLILSSATAPKYALSLNALSPDNRGYTDEVIGADDWRVFSLWDDHDEFLIQVGERYDIREELTGKISRQLITPSLISLPFLGVMIWVGIGRGLNPVQRVAEEVTRRDPQYLAQMQIGPVPSEIRPVVNALNLLFERLHVALQKERQFTDDAAHELRTPLAALKTQAQVAMRATDDEQRRQALQNVINSVDRANHLVDQMLTLARLDPQSNALQHEVINLHQIAANVIAQLVPKAMANNINVELIGDELAMVKVEPVSISILIRNLVDNAIRYTPIGGEVIVNIERISFDKIMLSITDTGPGIEEELRARVFDRFFRVLGNTSSGCGLGLSIVKRIADLHHLKIELKNKTQENGLMVNVTFPTLATLI